MLVKLNFYKVLELPAEPQADAIYYVFNEDDSIADWYVTNSSGEAFPAGNASAPSALVYRALLTQSGTDAPVATVLENTLGGTVVWTRASAGVYDGTLTGAFTANKTFLLPAGFTGVNFGDPAGGGGIAVVAVVRTSANAVQVRSTTLLIDAENTAGAPLDDLLSATSVEIIVYP